MIVEPGEISAANRSESNPGFEMAETVGYRSVSKTAVMSFVFAVFSLAVWLSKAFLLFPILGLMFWGAAWINFRRYPKELVGRWLMRIGGIVSVTAFAGGLSWHVYCYFTEVPPNYQRISFRILQPERDSRMPYSKATEELDGKKVFIKGYVRPSDKQTNLKNFILVGDFGQCCFGGSPKITDVIAVALQDDLRVDYSWQVRHIGGVFHLNKSPKKTTEKDVPQVVYTIEADYLK